MDDLVATKLLKMNEISQSSVDTGTGFLPMFGPAYIPFYDSHREYSDVYDKYSELNHGVVSLPISSFLSILGGYLALKNVKTKNIYTAFKTINNSLSKKLQTGYRYNSTFSVA